MEQVIQIVSSLGFPIAACCVMFWYMNKEREDHKQESAEMTSAINKLNTTLEKLLTKAGIEDE